MTVTTQVPRGSIVVGIDATGPARDALAWAVEEAQTRGRPLVLVHGVGTSVTPWLDVERVDLREVMESAAIQGQRVLREAAQIAASSAPGLEVHCVLRMTSPRRALMDLADDAALVVVGARSDRCPEGTLLDTALGCVADHAPCPVVVPRPRPTPGCGVVVMCDGSPESRRVLAYAGALARVRSLPLSVVHCLPDPPAALGQQDLLLMDAAERAEASLGPSQLGFERLLLHDLVHEMRSQWGDAEVRVLLDDAAADDCLAHAARSADYLVAGAGHARRLGEVVLSSTTPEEVECVTVVLPETPVARVDVAEPRIVLARLGGAAHRMTVLGIAPDQAVRELLTISTDHELLSWAAALAFADCRGHATKAWQTIEVAELLMLAAAATLDQGSVPGEPTLGEWWRSVG